MIITHSEYSKIYSKHLIIEYWLLQILEMYVVDTKNLPWFASGLNSKKKYIKINQCTGRVEQDMKCQKYLSGLQLY